MTPEIKKLFEQAEAGPRGYDAFNRGTRTEEDGSKSVIPANREVDFSKLTLGEVMAAQKLPKANPESMFAVGLYQITPKTLAAAAQSLHLDANEKFDAELQDRVFSGYLMQKKQPDIAAYIRGDEKVSLKRAQHALSEEWAGMPDPYKQGRSHYDKGTGNSAHLSLKESAAFLGSLRTTYAALRASGVSEEAAWSGVFTANHLKAAQEAPAKSATSEKPAATPKVTHTESTPVKDSVKPSVKDTHDGFLDQIEKLPVLREVEKIAKKAESTLDGFTPEKIVGTVLSTATGKALDRAGAQMMNEVAALPGNILHKVEDLLSGEKSPHVAQEKEPTKAAPKAPSAAAHEQPTSVPQVASPKPTASEKAPMVCTPALTNDPDLRLLYQAQGHFAGDAHAVMDSLDADARNRVLHAVVAEARVAGFENIAEVRASKDLRGIVAYDGPSDSAGSRRLYIDRAQAVEQSLERSLSIINEFALPPVHANAQTQNMQLTLAAQQR